MKHVMLALVLGVAVVHASRELTQDAVRPQAISAALPVSEPQPGGAIVTNTSLPPVPKSYIPVMARSTYTRTGKYFMPAGDEADAGELGPKVPKAEAAVPRPGAAAVPRPGAAAVPKPGAQNPRKQAAPVLVWPGPIKGEELQPRIITRP